MQRACVCEPIEWTDVTTGETVTPARLHGFHWPALRRLLSDHPQLQQKLSIKLVHDLRQAEAHIMMLGQQSIRRRLAMFLRDFI